MDNTRKYILDNLHELNEMQLQIVLDILHGRRTFPVIEAHEADEDIFISANI